MFSTPLCQSLVFQHDMISRSHSMYNAYPKLYFTCARAPLPLPSLQGCGHTLTLKLWHSDALFGHIYDQFQARFMTSRVRLFHQIPRQDPIHGRCGRYLLCFQIGEAQRCRASERSYKKNPHLHVFSAVYLFSPSYGEKENKALGNFYYTLLQLHHRHKTTHI